MEPIDNNISMEFFSYGSGRSNQLNLNIPDKFILVLNRIIPEIEKISVDSTNLIMTPNYYGLGTFEEKFLVEMRTSIIIKESPNILSKEKYVDKINDLFRMTYPQYDFVRIIINTVQINKKNYLEEFLKEFKK